MEIPTPKELEVLIETSPLPDPAQSVANAIVEEMLLGANSLERNSLNLDSRMYGLLKEKFRRKGWSLSRVLDPSRSYPDIATHTYSWKPINVPPKYSVPQKY